jgi:hypothetical protein
MQMPAQHLLLSAQVLLPLLHNLLCFTAAEPAPSATTLTMLLQAGISYAQCALRTHLDIAACVKAVKLVDDLKHSALHLVVTTSTVVKACTTWRQQCTQAGRHMASRHEVSACVRKSKPETQRYQAVLYKCQVGCCFEDCRTAADLVQQAGTASITSTAQQQLKHQELC